MCENIVSVKTMRLMDAATLKREKITEYALMKRAGVRVARALLAQPWFKREMKVVVVCGTGNNGGDGMVIGRYLQDKEYDVETIIIGDDAQRSEASISAKEALGSRAKQWEKNEPFDELYGALDNADVIVDALFGIGLKGDLRAPYRSLVKYMNSVKAVRVAVDIASGLNADTGTALTAVQADLTFAIQCVKYGHLMHDGKTFSGRVAVVDVGIKTLKDVPLREIIGIEAVGNIFAPRQANTHKYHYGNVFIIGGTKSMPGAPTLAAHAAYRAGCGLVSHVAAGTDSVQRLQVMPEVMHKRYQDIVELTQLLRNADAIAFGVGLGEPDASKRAVLDAVLTSEKPVVIDADGLKLLSTEQLSSIVQPSWVLTPHGGEFKRLAGVDAITVEAAEAFNKQTGGVLVLKGPTTLIVYQGIATFMPLGTPALAVAGTGDVLSGIIAARLGCGQALFDAAKEGVVMHALAGLKASEKTGEHAMIASDLIAVLPEVVKSLTPVSIGRF